MKVQIIDLDGCISDDRHRRVLIDTDLAEDRRPHMLPAREAMWQRYHEHCDKDPVANLDHINRDAATVVLTARPINRHQQTLHWLASMAGIIPTFMIMRNLNDHRPSVDLKEWMVRCLFDPNAYGLHPEQIVEAIDDRSTIVRMYYRTFGFNSKVVRIGTEEHEYA